MLMSVHVKLYPPLNTAIGASRVELPADGLETIKDIIMNLTEKFGENFRSCLFDTDGCLIPAWCVFVNNGPPIHFNRSDALHASVSNGNEVTFLLALAGG